MFRKKFWNVSFSKNFQFSSFSQDFLRFFWMGWLPKNPKFLGDPFPLDPNLYLLFHCDFTWHQPHFFVFSKKFKKTMFKKLTPCGTRTRNLWIRSPTRYPLRQRGLIWFSSEKKRNNEWEPCTKKNSPAGNWTRVFRVTGGNTDLYTTEDTIFALIYFCASKWSKMSTETTKMHENLWTKNESQSAGLEPARAEPNGFLVHLRNHLDTTAVILTVLCF